jgi:hypothetical protein
VGGGGCKTGFVYCVPELTRTAWAVFKYCGTRLILGFLEKKLKSNLTRTAWAVFKYCGTKTVTLRIRKKI